MDSKELKVNYKEYEGSQNLKIYDKEEKTLIINKKYWLANPLKIILKYIEELKINYKKAL